MARLSLNGVRCLVLLLVLSALAACAPGNVVVLLPDPEGKVGKVTLSNSAGSQTLDRAGQAVFFSDAGSAPRAPETMAPEEIQRRFGEALAARPSQPVGFILYFAPNSTELVESSRDQLPQIIAAVKRRESVDVSVVGHCDTTGDDAYNLRLSRERAETVARQLTAQGVDPKTLEITSHGKRRLLVPTADNVSEPRNRRVEVTVR